MILWHIWFSTLLKLSHSLLSLCHFKPLKSSKKINDGNTLWNPYVIFRHEKESKDNLYEVIPNGKWKTVTSMMVTQCSMGNSERKIILKRNQSSMNFFHDRSSSLLSFLCIARLHRHYDQCVLSAILPIKNRLNTQPWLKKKLKYKNSESGS